MHRTRPPRGPPTGPPAQPLRDHRACAERAISSLTYDRVYVVLSAWLIRGLFVDGWAYLTMPSLESFFAPWHGLVYSGFFAVLVPMVVYEAFFTVLLDTSGLWWPIHLWAGDVFLAGVVGWLLSLLATLPLAPAETAGGGAAAVA